MFHPLTCTSQWPAWGLNVICDDNCRLKLLYVNNRRSQLTREWIRIIFMAYVNRWPNLVTKMNTSRCSAMKDSELAARFSNWGTGFIFFSRQFLPRLIQINGSIYWSDGSGFRQRLLVLNNNRVWLYKTLSIDWCHSRIFQGLEVVHALTWMLSLPSYPNVLFFVVNEVCARLS